jgi:protein required for attachment to host cells
MTTWILVADSAHAKLFTTELPETPWSLVKEFDNPDGRKTSHEIDPSSPPGRMQVAKSLGAQRSAMEPHSTPKEAAAGRFAHELAAFVQNGRNTSQFDKVVLVAPPHFLGQLRELMAAHLGAALAKSIDKDLVACNGAELRERLSEAIFGR